MSDCVCASAISAEMKDWVALGGGNSGCCGNAAHTYGFHCPANRVPVSDYSRRRDPGTPYRMNWGCAGDFHHGYDAQLMALHADVLTRLMRGEFPMIAEMITKPWKNKPVYYWARWNGLGTLQRYTGTGHDHWSHISWFRSKAHQRAYLWKPGAAPAPAPAPAAETKGTVAPKYPGYVLRRSTKPDANVKVWQNQAVAKGYKLAADSIFGPGTEAVVAKVQADNKLAADKVIGPKTWSVLWS
jgi:peptidoglycan hydrolase-like protein with peptidoglycan-binding domain